MTDETQFSNAENAVHEITAAFGQRWPDDYASRIVRAVLKATGGQLMPAGYQWRMKNPATGDWSPWKQGRATWGSHVQTQEREVFAIVFSDVNPEQRFIEDAENSCPHCGGSGHKDDVREVTA